MPVVGFPTLARNRKLTIVDPVAYKVADLLRGWVKSVNTRHRPKVLVEENSVSKKKTIP